MKREERLRVGVWRGRGKELKLCSVRKGLRHAEAHRCTNTTIASRVPGLCWLRCSWLYLGQDPNGARTRKSEIKDLHGWMVLGWRTRRAPARTQATHRDHSPEPSPMPRPIPAVLMHPRGIASPLLPSRGIRECTKIYRLNKEKKKRLREEA